MHGLFQDLRYAMRLLAKSPSFTLVAVLALALGIGSNTAIFSVVNGVLLRPLAYPEPERLVYLNEANIQLGFPTFSVAPGTFLDWQTQNQVFENIAALGSSDFNLTGIDKPERISGRRVSATLFSVLRLQPELGRLFLPEDDATGRDHVVLLGHAFWQSRFGGDKQIVGKKLTLNGQSRTIVGVVKMPTFDSAIFVPLSLSDGERKNQGGHYLSAVARLRPGVSLAQAQAAMDVIAVNLEQQYPDVKKGWTVGVKPLLEVIVGEVRPALLLLLWAVGFVLLIACMNVANLLLARGAARQKEFGIRAAMGAGRWRVVRLLLIESLLLGLIGGIAGVLLAAWGLEFLQRVHPANLPRLQDVHLDGRVLAFTILISLATSVIFGLVPALHATRSDLNESLKEEGRGMSAGQRRNRLRSALVVVEIALSLVLLVNAGLMIRSFVRVNGEPTGYDTSHVLAVDIGLPWGKYRNPQEQAAFFEDLMERVGATPGVQSIAAVSDIPLGDNNNWIATHVHGKPPPAPGEPASAAYRQISPNYFRTMKIPLVAGREFTGQDRGSEQGLVIVNEKFTRAFFPGEQALGRLIHVSDGGPDPCEIVGVIKDVKNFGLETPIPPEIYLHQRQRSWGSFSVVMRTAAQPGAMTAVVRNAVLAIDKDQPIHNVRTMEQLFVSSLAGRRLMMMWMGIFAAVALVLCAIGIYGLISYTVAQRTREFGIRKALGAKVSDVLILVLRQGGKLTVAGLLLGLIGASSSTRLLSNQLYGVEPHDPLTFMLGFVTLGGVALVACLVPARRATRVDPNTTLRYE